MKWWKWKMKKTIGAVKKLESQLEKGLEKNRAKLCKSCRLKNAEKYCKLNTHLQDLASTQPRMSFPSFESFCEMGIFHIIPYPRPSSPGGHKCRPAHYRYRALGRRPLITNMPPRPPRALARLAYCNAPPRTLTGSGRRASLAPPDGQRLEHASSAIRASVTITYNNRTCLQDIKHPPPEYRFIIWHLVSELNWQKITCL